ncbi:MAG: hypothetical protein Q4C50_02690 [Eubacteriales bacterium]|nr:hypothetical protein [Eubacteriales bacterium]
MDFVVYFVQTVIKMILVAIVALGGIRLGKVLRDRKDEKKAAEDSKTA